MGRDCWGRHPLYVTRAAYKNLCQLSWVRAQTTRDKAAASRSIFLQMAAYSVSDRFFFHLWFLSKSDPRFLEKVCPWIPVSFSGCRVYVPSNIYIYIYLFCKCFSQKTFQYDDMPKCHDLLFPGWSFQSHGNDLLWPLWELAASETVDCYGCQPRGSAACCCASWGITCACRRCSKQLM